MRSRTVYRWWVASPFLVLFATGAFAQAVETTGTSKLTPRPAPPAEQLALDEAVFPGLATKISLDLRGIDAVEVLKFLSSKGNFNIVAGPDVQGRVTLILTDVTVKDALDIILVSNGLAVDRRANILYVLSGQTYEQLYGHRYGDPRESLIIQLKYANPGQVGTLLGNLKSSVGRIVIDEPTATVALLDTPAVLAQMQAIIARVDIPSVQRQLPTDTRVLPLHFAKAEDVKPELDSVLTPEIGQARLDKRSNALVVTDVPANFPRIEQLVQAFDARNRQVYIESSILSITLRDEFDTGVEWNFMSESRHFPNVNITSTLPIDSGAANGLRMVVGTIANNDITATIRALQTFGDTRVLSSPHIAAMNNEEARIHVGRREVYVTSTTTTGLSTGDTAEQVNFVDVGVKLNVTPIINETGFITMKIRPEVSSVAEFRPTARGNSIPVVETSEAETKVMVKDGTTVIIGGLMKDTTTLAVQKVPLLGHLPVLGALFTSRLDHVRKEELVILLTPHVITGEEFVAPTSATARVEWPDDADVPP